MSIANTGLRSRLLKRKSFLRCQSSKTFCSSALSHRFSLIFGKNSTKSLRFSSDFFCSSPYITKYGHSRISLIKSALVLSLVLGVNKFQAFSACSACFFASSIFFFICSSTSRKEHVEHADGLQPLIFHTLDLSIAVIGQAHI